MPLNYLKSKKPCQQEQPRKSYFTNDLIDKIADIFMSYKKHADYKLALKLRYDSPRKSFQRVRSNRN